jgi:hypothetical protein
MHVGNEECTELTARRHAGISPYLLRRNAPDSERMNPKLSRNRDEKGIQLEH